MKFFLEEKYPKSDIKVEYGDLVLFLGSCFSQNICQKGRDLGFNFKNTNYGTIFHPIPIARIISEAISLNQVYRIIEQEGRFYSWDASSWLVEETENKLKERLEKERFELHENLKHAKYLFLTFGTTKEYQYKDEITVANCHKVSANQFSCSKTNLQDLNHIYTELIEEIQIFNPDIQIVVTVSPVRHVKDGLIENNRSKARLLLLCEELDKLSNVSYFPSYELIVDQLRDYRFYNADLVHPSEVAINYVWELFQEIYFAKETIEMSEKINKFRMYFAHRSRMQENEKEQSIRLENENKLKLFLALYPQIIL